MLRAKDYDWGQKQFTVTGNVMKKIYIVAGARPNFMKVAPLVRELSKFNNEFTVKLVHTGQHYDQNMSQVFFEELGIPTPDVSFDVGSGSHAEQTAKVMVNFESYCQQDKPDLVVVVGDVNSTLACAIVAKKLQLNLAHVEAGLRSHDRTMPEEINRLATDSISDIMFVTEQSGLDNLRNEGVPENKIHYVGNLMIDTLVYNLDKVASRSLPVDVRNYALVTLHRPSNVDSADNLRVLMDILSEISKQFPVVFPAHPRTQKNMREFGLFPDADSSIKILNPLGYIDFLNLMKNASFCLTDSGGIQEETTVLSVPCLTVRENTERPVTITEGTNTLVPLDRAVILKHVEEIVQKRYKKGTAPKFWDGRSAERIRAVLQKIL